MKDFENIIGYESVKKELRQISDVLKNKEFYEKLGVRAPRGLLLYGEPGVGGLRRRPTKGRISERFSYRHNNVGGIDKDAARAIFLEDTYLYSMPSL